MVLSRTPFVFFAGGFATSCLINQLLLGLTTSKLNTDLKVIVFSWCVYISLVLFKGWSDFEDLSPPWYAYLIYASTIFYNITICGIFYLSVQRFLAMMTSADMKDKIKKIAYAFLTVALLCRMIRTILIFIQNTGTGIFTASNILHVVTIFPILMIRLVLDCFSFHRLYYVTIVDANVATSKNEHTNALKTIVGTNTDKKKTFQKLMLSLAFDICMCCVAIVIACLEAINYAGNKPAFMDWILISWVLHSYTDQKKTIQALFRRDQVHSKAAAPSASVAGKKQSNLMNETNE